MNAPLSLEQLTKAVGDGEIDTVIVAQTDMQGRLMGKRFHAQHFLDSAIEETHACNYLLTVDMEMEPVPGYQSASWQQGYGDYVMKPDLTTLRRIPWLEGTALVLCDVLDHHSREPIVISPRAVLKRQLERLNPMGFAVNMASELEFYLFQQSYQEAQVQGYRGLTPVSAYNEDYHIFQTTKEEGVMRAIRNGLFGAGIPVENSKGEAWAGQEEINVRYSDALTAADNHVITKTGVKEIAWSKGQAATFMAKYDDEAAGSSSHVHQSLWSIDGKTPCFLDADGEYGMSQTMRHYLAGLLTHAAEFTAFLAPNINSYKRFQAGTFAPNKAVWSQDNRTAGYRICGAGTRGIRIECRVGGADLNPYLAFACQIAAGIAGIENRLPLEPELKGDAYAADNVQQIPSTLREAAVSLKGSAMLRAAMGDAVVDHYVHAAEWEQREHDRRVTDWEIARGFERS
ncbi:glutamine synthetase family protein [Gammaproteobacteria bacterium]|nr:glutamine synthetase family protein [Gammaproteobacteria bacterium]